MKGYFISFEGGEGSGKSTQIQYLAEWIKSQNLGYEVLVTREPGGTKSAEAIRDLLVKGTADKWRPATEALLMSASRHEHVEHVLRPALAAGRIVLCDRYNDSTRVYQGVVGGVPRQDIEALNDLACGDLVPDLTILLDMDVDVGLARAGARDSNESRFESKGLQFHRQVRDAFLNLAQEHKHRFEVVDATDTKEAISHRICALVRQRLAGVGLMTGPSV